MSDLLRDLLFLVRTVVAVEKRVERSAQGSDEGSARLKYLLKGSIYWGDLYTRFEISAQGSVQGPAEGSAVFVRI